MRGQMSTLREKKTNIKPVLEDKIEKDHLAFRLQTIEER